MNTEISTVTRAKDTKFGVRVYVYYTQMPVILNRIYYFIYKENFQDFTYNLCTLHFYSITM